MSLNWREIDAVLEELRLPDYHIQQVYQPDFRNLVFELYRPGARIFLLLSLEQGRTRLHETSRKPRKSRKVQRFEAFLKARIRGGRIISADQPESERVVRFVIERASEQTILWLRLWGGAANLIATDTDLTILDCFFRRPKRNEISGAVFDTGFLRNSEPGGAQARERFIVRDFPDSDTLNEHLDSFYHGQIEEESVDKIRSECISLIRRRESSLQARLDDVQRGIIEADSSEQYRHQADLILSSLHVIEDRAESVTTTDWANENREITLQLDPHMSPSENAQMLYQKAQKAEERRQDLIDKQSGIRALLEDLRALEEQAQETDSIRELTAIRFQVAPSDRASGNELKTASPGLRFESNGFIILVGRNARENDALLRRHVRGNDLWLHTRDYPGGYVFVLHRGSKSPPLETLIDAGHLAVHYSQASAEKLVDLYYTQVKYLRRARDAGTGTVLPTQEKNFVVRMEAERLQKLLSQHSRY
ncbi:MAG: fibronectin-binding domain-containing protein [Spirochaetaceae bacterium]|nr:MAG: fibronectin-binding domain-containing protein [Spirochaetaceae bacterium]